jgi:selenocysteine-specific elongation factor
MTAGLVIGTAGHIDHGKTSLVRALTGAPALDRLPEERERGITITLGFAALKLPDGRPVSFVDVPGHERLVRTMIAGATGIDAVLLCVSAVDGVMPQTREHLAILDLLGVKRGILVLTMVDLVDAELRELAADDIRTAVKGTFLAEAPLVGVSSVTREGLDDLVALISDFPATSRPVDGPFRMPVDRAFVRSGFGTVVTGTTWSGTLADGATVTLLPEGVTARVRGIETHGSATALATPGHRTALNLAGVERADAARGTVVVAGQVPSSSMIDVLYTQIAGAHELEDGAPVRVLLGTAERTGHLYLAEEADQLTAGTHPAQLRLDGPLPSLPGDRFVVRRISPVETLGGGVVVDPWAHRLRRKDRVAAGDEIRRLQAGNGLVWLDRAGESGLTVEEWAARGTGGRRIGPRVFSDDVAMRLEGILLGMIAAFHQENPLARGAKRRELRRDRVGHLEEAVFDALVDQLVASGKVEIEGPLVRAKGFSVELSPHVRALRTAVLAEITAAALDGLETKHLAAKHPEAELPALLVLLENEEKILVIGGVGWVARPEIGGLERKLRQYFSSHHKMDTGAFKELTGTTRKTAIPLLEWLDKRKLTVRVGDARIAGPALAR